MEADSVTTGDFGGGGVARPEMEMDEAMEVADSARGGADGGVGEATPSSRCLSVSVGAGVGDDIVGATSTWSGVGVGD